MNRSEHHRDRRLQHGYDVSFTPVLSLPYHAWCRMRNLQPPAIMTTPHTRPRPGRRRLSMQILPLSLTQILLFTSIILSVLCMPTEAAERPGSQSRAVKGQFVDGRIMFDHNAAPLPVLHRRDDPASTDTASATTAPEAVATSSSSDPSTTTTSSLPRAFDGGFGTNYTQPSCPTFLRSMVNNDTFISCVPFSLLLQVRHLPMPSSSPPQKEEHSKPSHPPYTTEN